MAAALCNPIESVLFFAKIALLPQIVYRMMTNDARSVANIIVFFIYDLCFYYSTSNYEGPFFILFFSFAIAIASELSYHSHCAPRFNFYADHIMRRAFGAGASLLHLFIWILAEFKEAPAYLFACACFLLSISSIYFSVMYIFRKK